jgi:hypothetical protein
MPAVCLPCSGYSVRFSCRLQPAVQHLYIIFNSLFRYHSVLCGVSRMSIIIICFSTYLHGSHITRRTTPSLHLSFPIRYLSTRNVVQYHVRIIVQVIDIHSHMYLSVPLQVLLRSMISAYQSEAQLPRQSFTTSPEIRANGTTSSHTGLKDITSVVSLGSYGRFC